jgi:hypothetical protein
MDRTLTGEVLYKEGQFFVVKTDGPSHLTTMHMTPREMKDGDVGDVVELKYFSTNTYGFWYVSRVVDKGPVSDEEQLLSRYLP